MNAPSKNDWIWHVAAQEGEKLLAKIARGWEPECSSKDLENARLDAMTAMIDPRSFPSPVKVADDLLCADPDAAEALAAAYRSKADPYAGQLRVSAHHAAENHVLRALGLTGWIGRDVDHGFALTAFGGQVRRVLRGEAGYGL